MINSANYFTDKVNNCDNNSRNEADSTCVDIDNWFDQLLKDQTKRNTENDATCSKANSDMHKLKEELKLGNEKTPQHNVNEFSNQMIFLDRSNCLCEDKKSKKMYAKCMFVHDI